MSDSTPDYLVDIDLAAAIAAALHLQLDGGGNGVKVSVSNGVVTLEGSVADKRTRENVERIAGTFAVGGVVNAIALSGKRVLSRDGVRVKRQTQP